MTTQVAYLTSGIRPLGKVHTYATLMPTANTHSPQQNLLARMQDKPFVPPMINAAVQRDPTSKVLGKKSAIDTVRQVSKPKNDSLSGVNARISARNQPKEPLARYKPMQEKLTPLADSHFAGLNNLLKQPK